MIQWRIRILGRVHANGHVFMCILRAAWWLPFRILVTWEVTSTVVPYTMLKPEARLGEI